MKSPANLTRIYKSSWYYLKSIGGININVINGVNKIKKKNKS